MKRIFYLSFLIGLLAMLFVGCKKDETKAILHVPKNQEISFSASETTMELDSLHPSSVATTFDWDALTYNQDLAVTYTLQFVNVDSSFDLPVTLPVGSATFDSIATGNLNRMAILSGLMPDVQAKMKVRIKAAVEGLNSAPQQIQPVYSDPVTLTVTPYVPETKYPVPENLYLIGNATPSGWTQPVKVPEQQFYKANFYTFKIKIHLTGGGDNRYLFIPENGSWDHKYAVGDKTDPADAKTGTDFVVDKGDDIPAPDQSGWYIITVNFLSGKYEVEPTTAPGNQNPGNDDDNPTDTIPEDLYIVGGATAGGWTRPVAYPDQQHFDMVNDYTFETIAYLESGKSYLLTPKNVDGNIDKKYAVADNSTPEAKTGTTFTTNSGENIPAPDNSGWYKISVNFKTGKYQVTAVAAPEPPGEAPSELYIVGGATDDGWTLPVTTAQKFEKVNDHTFKIDVHLTAGKDYLLTSSNAAGNITDKYGVADKTASEAKTGTSFEYHSGENIPAPDQDGWYNIVVNFATGIYTVTQGDNPNDNVPGNLYIIGNATQGGWANPVPVPEQQFEKTDNHTFQIISYLKSDSEYLFIPENGSWDHKYGVADNTAPEAKTGTSFAVDGGQNIPSPDQDGWYKITVDFNTGKYAVVEQKNDDNTTSQTVPSDIPDNLYILGDAVGSWDNPVADESKQTLTKVNAYKFMITTQLTEGKSYKFILKNDGSWDTSIGIGDANTGNKLHDVFAMGSNPGNIPAPDETGTYKIVLNFLDYTYTLTKK